MSTRNMVEKMLSLLAFGFSYVKCQSEILAYRKQPVTISAVHKIVGTYGTYSFLGAQLVIWQISKNNFMICIFLCTGT